MRESRGVWFLVASGQNVRLLVLVRSTGKYETIWKGELSAFCCGTVPYRRRPRFGSLIAKLLNEACARGLIDRFVLVASPQMGRNIREGLDPAVSSCLVGEVSQNLSRFHDDELGKHLAKLSLTRSERSEPTETSNRERYMQHNPRVASFAEDNGRKDAGPDPRPGLGFRH